MGFGRFAFTGLYPLMVGEGVLSVNGGSLAASANYAGYLLGALALARCPERLAASLCRVALVGTLLGLAAMAVPAPAWFAIGVRLLAGVLSAVALVGASVWLLHVMQRHGGAPLMFSGVGLGILISAELIAGGHGAGLGSPAIWLLLAGAGSVLALLAWPALSRPAPAPVKTAPHVAPAVPMAPASLLLIYGLAGFGYIITATYLPLLMRGGALSPLQAWAVFGLAAAPSCFFWHWLHGRLGTRRALAANLLVQALGVILPVLQHSAPAYLASALLVGGTFMGTPTIALPAARLAAAKVRFNMLAAMTAVYGVGQIVGPLASSALYHLDGSFSPALLAAGAALLLGAACTWQPARAAASCPR
ncbi:YbfB/YjiJ family MFS transporter [Pseudomonas sp. UMC631]|nr:MULTISPECIES: YbfB/YjiJ family MFS transporter [unclassified Pseudomonas]NTX88826.1 YbfB/YjiJ family MFS transporter [Pseudomonas sp. UMA643]NTY17373.1 YbfB/YjiJ family MFS transporter [Pseudomonas sp. UMC3103]NTY24871.1 YbfB/YjiJ family MFS transporter [Pseudomonas sp. UMA603]NTY32406.1 YbfB/YjiJ family MFS transporter [Pseudomonas sp. UMC3129]NTY55594.1 YbfB/YjiJ family MFS transporter [Pseudomonas sp. UMC631]